LAVAFAHSRGVIHRDLKPANVMVGAFGEVQVMDWGIAKPVVRGEGNPAAAVDDTPAATANEPEIGSDVGPEDRTEVGEVLGTPAYMPPEQIRGGEVNERSDVFALGGILCAVLTGKPPYTGRSGQEVWRTASRGAIEDALARLDAVTGSGQFRMIAKRCLHPDPIRRYAHAGEVAAAVHAARAKARAVARRDELADATEDADHLQRRANRRARYAVAFGFAGLALALTIALGAALYVDYVRTNSNQSTVEREKLDAEHQKELFPTLVAAAHRLADDGAFNPAADPAGRDRVVGQLERTVPHLAPADAAHGHVLLYGIYSIALDTDTARKHWDLAVERYKAVAAEHTEVALAVRVESWFTHKPTSKLDRTVLLRTTGILRAAISNPTLPDELRQQATAALGQPK
jgi:hypothetical protein